MRPRRAARARRCLVAVGAVSLRRTPRRRRPSRPCRAVGQHEDDGVVAAGARAAVRAVPSPSPSCGPSARKNGHVGAERGGELVQLRRRASGRSSVSFASRSAAAASELPPPSPAATGIRLSMRTLPAPARRRPPRRAARAPPDERVVWKAVDAQAPRPARARSRSARLDPLEHGRRPRACRRRRRGPTTSARLILARASTAPSSRGAAPSSTNSSGASASARVSAARPRAASASAACARVATPASSSEFGSVLRRCANAASTTRLISREVARAAACAGTRRAPSRRSAAAGRPCARPGGMPVRSAASCTSTETAP